MRYEVEDVVASGPFKGFIITQVKKGWYELYHPNNLKDGLKLEQVTTKCRWHWVEK